MYFEFMQSSDFSLYKDNRMLLQHIFFSHHNLFLYGRSGAVNEQACICIEWLQNCVPVAHFSDEKK